MTGDDVTKYPDDQPKQLQKKKIVTEKKEMTRESKQGSNGRQVKCRSHVSWWLCSCRTTTFASIVPWGIMTTVRTD